MHGRKPKPRVCIIGLDCADPRLVFERYADDLTTLTSLRSRGLWGRLHSCHPPITMPAWPVMMSGHGPGVLGIYGFRNRADYSYNNLSIATGRAVREPLLWDILTDSEGCADGYCIVLGVPGTYPPSAIRGDLVSGFLTPDTDRQYTHPPELADEIRRVVGDYQIDVHNFRTDDKDRLLDEIHSMTRKRFALFRHLLRTRPWDFAIMVEMGPDRIHHGFWRFCDPDHRLYEPANPYQDVMRDYYRMIDNEIGETLNIVNNQPPAHPSAETTVMIVSDHGARPLEGGFAFNEWLLREGYLVLKQGARRREPAPISRTAREPSQTRTPCEPSSASGSPRAPSPISRIPLEPAMVDWSRTRAWAEGGYYGRLFLNIEGREPQGIIPPGEVDGLLTELEEKLRTLPDDRGRPMGNIACRPSQLYKEVNGIPPDLMVYFGNLAWRSIGSIVADSGAVDPAGADTPGPTGPGSESLYTPENDTGPDDANHDWDGILIVTRNPAAGTESDTPSRKTHNGYIEGAHILDIAPTVLHLLGRPVPTSMQGKVLLRP